MPTKKYLTILLLTILAHSFDFDVMDEQPILTAGTCRMATQCRDPNLTEYKYNGIAKSGYLNVELKNGSALGFMFFGKIGVTNPSQLRNYPLIVSLGGGPGASAQFNSLRQYGPLNLKKVFSISVEDNKYTWARDANLLFIDQPIGTGVSCAADNSFIPTTMADVVVDFYRAFNQIFNDDGCFSSKNLNIPASVPMFIFGEGYAGKFVSAIAAKIINQKNNGGRITNLRGIGIGGGLNSPFRLMTQIGNYGFSLGLLDYQQRIRMEKIILRANFNQQNKQWARLTTDFERSLNYLYERTGVSYYDITQDGFQEDLVQYFFSGSLGNLKKFGFEATNLTFESLSKQVYSKLAADFMLPETQSLEFVLNSKIPVLLYQGQDDAYSNPTGAIRWIEQLRFTNSQQFRSKNLQAWKVNGVMFGSTKSAGKLTFTIVNNAGHYVPKDNPEAAYYMFSSWMRANLA